MKKKVGKKNVDEAFHAGKRLKKVAMWLLANKGIDQQMLYRQLGITSPTLYKWYRLPEFSQKQRMTLEMLSSFGINLQYFTHEDAPMMGERDEQKESSVAVTALIKAQEKMINLMEGLIESVETMIKQQKSPKK